MPASVATSSGLPQRLGKYELLLPLAAGGMARIYVGRTTGIGSFERHVVLKLITPERANEQTAVQMFLDEARLAASLNHQNVAQVFEVGEDAGIHYLAMEYVHGQDLRALLAKAGSHGTRIPLELALTVVAGAAAGLHHAHERRGPDGEPLGIVHRDVSPSNIMIGYDGAVKLLDFGIAKAASRSVETQSGIIKGKFAYMSPEQCRGREVDCRSDVFSLGIILYEITTQHRCFRADSDFDTMHRIVTGDVVRPTRLVQGYPQALEAIVMKALAVDASQRYQSAGLLLEALESFAVSARMSLSTMGLGRFMRELFGEVPEPWLSSATRHQAPPVAPKENTISSTDGRGSGSFASVARPADAGDDEVDDDPVAESLAGQTVLDLPRDPRREPEPQVHEWNDAKHYPAAQPAVASAPVAMPAPVAAPPAALAAEPYPMPAVGRTPTPRGPVAPPSGLPHPPAGTQPLPGGPQLVPAGAFATPPSSSGPAMPAGLHGYAVSMPGSDLGYPRYEPPPEPPADVKIAANRRPLYIGIGISAVALLIIMLALGHGGNDKAGAARAAAAPAGDPAAAAASTAVPGASAAAAPTSEPAEDFISVRVGSTPPGADVMIAGTLIGTTPLDKKLRRGTKLVPLTIHLTGYLDVNTKLDLAADFEANPELKPIGTQDEPAAGSGSAQAAPAPVEPAPPPRPEASAPVAPAPAEPKAVEPKTVEKKPAEPKPAHAHASSTHATEHEHDHKPSKPAQPRCQPPGAYNPFDTSCNGQPCPICK